MPYFLDTILDILFPISCLQCRKAGAILCLNCKTNLPKFFEQENDFIFSTLNYHNKIVKKMVWMLKYGHKKELAKIFAEIIYENILEEMPDLKTFENFKNPILIPIPMSKKRLKERGFNQSELIAKYVSDITKDSLEEFVLEKDILKKIKDTTNQASIKDRSKRLKNLKDCFSIEDELSKQKVKNRNIILIDDVTTTGATLLEAKKILEKFGAKKVYAFVVAH